MKNFKLLILSFFLLGAVVSFTSCSDDPCEAVVCQNGGTCVEGTCDCPVGYSGTLCETHCSNDLIGTWTITIGQTGICNLESYIITRGANNKELTLSYTNTVDSDVYSTTVTSFSEDCSRLEYTSSEGFSGSISFDGTTLTDVLAFAGCTFTAEKQ